MNGIVEFLDGHFFAGLLLGIACTAALACLAAAAYMRYLHLHAARDWRCSVPICGDRFFIVPEAEYLHLDRMRNRILAAAPVRRRDEIPGRPEHDMTTHGTPLRPGS